MGRALRKKEGKDFGYVVLPVIYDHTSHEIDNENFQEILNVVRGLAANDERIIEEFKDKSQNSGRVTGAREEIFNIDPELLNESELVDNLSIKLWEKLSRFNWMPFEKATEYVWSLNLNSQMEWYEYCKSGKKPDDIPSGPYSIYKNNGWLSWGDWLGKTPGWNGKYIDYNSLKELVRKEKINSRGEWKNFKILNKNRFDIPTKPNKVYKNTGWKSWGEFLGTNRQRSGTIKYMDYGKAKKIIARLNLKSSKEWRKYCKTDKLPYDIPKTPRQVYKNKGWISMGDWLGTDLVATYNVKYRSFLTARTFVRNKNFKKISEWHKYCKSGKKT